MHFDHLAQDWDKDPQKVKRAQIVASEIIKAINPSQTQTALEFGCGTGLLSMQLRDKFKNITLADTSEGMIHVLKEKIKYHDLLNFIPLQIDLLSSNQNIGPFDVIYTLMTLHHISDIDRIMDVFNTLLKPDGYLCIADLVKEDGSFHDHLANFDGHNGFEKAGLSSILSNHGFQTKYYNICFEVEKGPQSSIKKFPAFLLVARKSN